MNSIKRFSIFICALFSGACSYIQTKDIDVYEYRSFTATEGELLYRALMPEQFDEQKKYPLVIFLHGAGERGSDNRAQLAHGAMQFTGENAKKFSAVALFPQVPRDQYWVAVDADRSTRPIGFTFSDTPKQTLPMRKLVELIDSYANQPWVDTSRIYLMGVSMGGMGTFQLIGDYPDKFAAAVAVCGGASESVIKRISPDTKIWVFHGEKDNIVSVNHSIDAAKWLRENGNEPRLTLYPDDKHDSWTSAFAEPKLLDWLFAQALK